MRRREFIGLVGGAAVWPLAVRAQPSARMPVVGVFWAYADAEDRLSFLKGLADRGYLPGKTFILEERYANGAASERLDALAAELIALNVDVLVSQAGDPTVALHRATSTIPIFFVGVDPVLQGWTLSLSKPEGNISGISQISAETSAKRLQLLQKTTAVSRVALLRDPTNMGAAFELSHLSDAAKEMGLSYEVFDASTRNDVDQAFQRMEEQHLQAVLAFSATFFSAERKRIAALGLRHRLAVMGPSKYFVEAGSLLSYGVDFPALWYGSAYFVDKILKGQRIGDLPVQQPKFYFCLNLRTAKALGIESAPAMRALADEVIE
jgi:putative ABC transport system substrate-binding protein